MNALPQRFPILALIALTLSLGTVPGLYAQGSFPYVVRKADEPDERKEMKVMVPYALATESLGGVVGLGGGINAGREPGTLFGTVFGSSNGSFLLMGGAANLAVPATRRFFVDAIISTGRGAERRLYVDSTEPTTESERSGSNSSDQENYITEDTYEGKIQVDLKYVLPWGEGKDEPIHKYFARGGMLVDGPSGGSWNPLSSGRTILSLRPQYWDQFIDPEGVDVAFRTMNMAAELEYDNRDFRPNPSRGSYQRLAATKDWGWLNDTDDWYMLEAEYSKYISIGAASWAKQQILAFNAATITTPSWETTGEDGRPPYFTGATLGGLDRMKGYPDHRFHDNAAVYYAAEYRMIPAGGVPLQSALKFLDVQWWQLVAFGELGRVAPSWNLSTLHTDMKWDAGLGIRGMFGSGIARIDLAYGEEGMNMAAMFGQSF